VARIVPFGVLSACHGARHGEIALALAAEFGPVEVDRADDALDALAVAIAPGRCGDPTGDLMAAGDALASLLVVDRSIGRPDVDDLLVPPILESGTGHELALVQVAVEAGRRAGIPLRAVASRDHLYVAHEHGVDGILLSPRHEWRAIDAADLDEGGLVGRCSHEVAYLVLGEILRRARGTGVLPTALVASELRLKLPIEESTRDRLRVDHARLRAQLN
jgi:hypothetical protein